METMTAKKERLEKVLIALGFKDYRVRSHLNLMSEQEIDQVLANTKAQNGEPFSNKVTVIIAWLPYIVTQIALLIMIWFEWSSAYKFLCR